jgi:hypothetical protein
MEGLSATLVYVGIGSVLATGVAILTVAVLFLRTARRYVDLAEERLELLREGEAFLLRVVARQQGLVSEESRARESERSERIPEMVGHPLGLRTSEESLSGFPTPERPDRQARQAPGTRGQASSAETAGRRRREGTLEAGAPGAAARPKDGAPPLGVKVPHPDDDVTPRVWNGSATQFFQKKYDLYLEHYEGSVRLAERLHQMRDEAGESHGAPEAREWDDKLRRAYDAVERSTQRLDVLEQHYPELATDGDRLSARLGIAGLHAGLEERFGSLS